MPITALSPSIQHARALKTFLSTLLPYRFSEFCLALFCSLLIGHTTVFLSAQSTGLNDGLASVQEAEQLKRKWIAERVQNLRQSNEISIVMDYSDSMQWNPVFSYTAAEAQIHIALFEGLLSYNPLDMTPQAGLARTWESSDDGLRYTFFLRKDARFSNGEAIDANSIAQTWFYLIRAGSTAPFSSLLDPIVGVQDYRNGKISAEDTGIKVLSPYVLELNLKHPGPEILAILCHHSLSPLPMSMLLEQDWFTFYQELETSISPDTGFLEPEGLKEPRKLISNGPYRLKSLSKAGMELEANPYYWNAGEVASKSIFIQRYYPWQDWEIGAALSSYKIDWVASGFSGFDQVRRRPGLIHISKSFGTSFFYFSDSNNPANSWSDARVRKALVLLLPLEELRKGIGGDAYLIPEMPGFESGKTLEKQDQEWALQLLEEAGYPDGKGLGTLRLRFPEQGSHEQFSQIIQEAWGILDCDLETVYDAPDALPKPGEQIPPFTLGILNWIGDYPDPATFLNLWRSDSSLNLFQHRDPAFDQLLQEAQQADSRKKRFELLSQAEEYLLQNGTVIPLWHSPSFNLYDSRFLDGFYQNVLDLHPLQTLRRIYRMPKGSA